MTISKKNIVLELSIYFSIEVITFCEKLKSDRHYDLSSQIFRSGTSIGANIHEAQNAESIQDFIHKFKIAAKEADELSYWLTLCSRSEHLPSSPLEDKLLDLRNIISKIIISSKKRVKYNSNKRVTKVSDIEEIYETITFPNFQISSFSN